MADRNPQKTKPATNKKNSEVQVETQHNHISEKQDKRKSLGKPGRNNTIFREMVIRMMGFLLSNI